MKRDPSQWEGNVANRRRYVRWKKSYEWIREKSMCERVMKQSCGPNAMNRYP